MVLLTNWGHLGDSHSIRVNLGHLPWLDTAFDAQGGTNMTTRLEAFMYQAAEFQRHAHQAVPRPS